MSTMLLTSLHIHTDYMDRSKLAGSATFAGHTGEVKITLNTERASRMLAIVAEEVVAAAQDVANLMKSSVIDQAERALTVESVAQTHIVDVSNKELDPL